MRHQLVDRLPGEHRSQDRAVVRAGVRVITWGKGQGHKQAGVQARLLEKTLRDCGRTSHLPALVWVSFKALSHLREVGRVGR